MQPGIRLSFQRKVTTPAWLTFAVIVMLVPLVAVVADAVKKIETFADAVGAALIALEARPSPRLDTAFIWIAYVVPLVSPVIVIGETASVGEIAVKDPLLIEY